MAINKEKIAAAAQKYFKKGNYDKALKEYEKIVKADPSENRYWKRIGDTQVRAGDKEGAIKTYLRISDDFLSKGFHKKALAILRQIQALDATIEDVYRKLAKVYIATEFMGDALHTLEQLAQLLERNGKDEEMIAVLQEMADIDPSKVIHRVHFAETLSRLNKKREAAKEFKEVATYLKGEKNDKDYIKVAERLLFHDPDDKETLRDLAEAYIRQKTPQNILKRLLEVYQSYPGDLDNLHILARVFLSMAKREKAIQVYKEMARLLLEQGKREQSNTIFERILEIDPRDRDALKGLGRFKERKPLPPNPAPKQAEPKVVELDGDDLIEVEDNLVELDVEELEEFEEDAEDLKVIEESEAFFRYGLVDKSLKNLDRVNNQEHPRLLQLKKEVYVKQAKKNEALQVLEQIAARLVSEDPEKAVEAAQEALQLASRVDWAETMLNELGSSMPDLKPMSTQEIASVLDLDDALNIMDELPEADEVLDIASLATTGENQTVAPKIHSIEEIDMALEEQEKAVAGGYEDPGEMESDLQEMLASLQGLTESSEFIQSAQGHDSDIILDASPVGVGTLEGDLSIGLDELAELQEASQSFIRINELSKDDIDIEAMSPESRGGGKEMPGADEFIAFSLDEIDEPAAPEEESDPFQMGLNDDKFMLNLEDSLNQGNPPPRRKKSNARSDFEKEATMDNYERLMSFSDQLTNELAFHDADSSNIDEPTPIADIELDEAHPAEEAIPQEVTDTFEEVEFFLEMALHQEAVDALFELHKSFPITAVREMIAKVADEGEIPNPLQATPEPADANQSEVETAPIEALFDEDPSNPFDIDEATPIVEPESIPELAREAEIAEVDNEPTAVTNAQELLKDTPAPQADEPGDNLFEDMNLDGFGENLDLDFNEEEATSLQALDLLSKGEQFHHVQQGGPGVRIETEQPIGDANTHLDLGLAYKEMGLMQQALEEINQAMDDPATEVQARLLAGKCYLEMGEATRAANEMKRALHREDLKISEEMDLYFELGRVYEELKDLPEALYYYKKVNRRDSSYRGVAEIIAKLDS